MTVRAKLNLFSITTNDYGHGHQPKTLNFQAQYDSSIPEDQRFQLATPTGNITLQIDNPAALEQFEAGKNYYVDFTPANVG